jgi:hypothetical protein
MNGWLIKCERIVRMTARNPAATGEIRLRSWDRDFACKETSRERPEVG